MLYGSYTAGGPKVWTPVWRLNASYTKPNNFKRKPRKIPSKFGRILPTLHILHVKTCDFWIFRRTSPIYATGRDRRKRRFWFSVSVLSQPSTNRHLRTQTATELYEYRRFPSFRYCRVNANSERNFLRVFYTFQRCQPTLFGIIYQVLARDRLPAFSSAAGRFKVHVGAPLSRSRDAHLCRWSSRPVIYLQENGFRKRDRAQRGENRKKKTNKLIVLEYSSIISNYNQIYIRSIRI